MEDRKRKGGTFIDVTMAETSTGTEVHLSNGDGKTDHDDEDCRIPQAWGSIFREFRHSQCMMTPVSLTMILTAAVLFLGTLIFQIPGLLLGILMAPLLKRTSWYVEFLYPLPISRWGHMLLMSFTSRIRFKAKDKNRGFHSRTIEQKVEVVPDRVYIHFLPQWLDNVGYLVLCLPEHENSGLPPVALVIDCGEMDAVVRAVKLIQEFHYSSLPEIQIQSILSTHKHHDHTGGNKGLLEHEIGNHINHVYGGAVERVPFCTDFLVDGEILSLPKYSSNNMNAVVEIEAIAVPAHTRGSLVYRLRSKVGEQTEFMFTGDTMFSGGGGVPFEADVGDESEKDLKKSNGNTHIRGNTGTMAMERCFTEIMARANPEDLSARAGERILIFPGHEYTQELLVRQFQSLVSEHNKWKNFSPRDYFETVSHMYVAFHRRSLPHNSGRLLLIPSSLRREVHINTHMRSLRRSADLVVRALSFWHSNFYTAKRDTIERSSSNGSTRISMDGSSNRSFRSSGRISFSEDQYLRRKTPSTFKRWTLDSKNVDDSVFTTVYTADLEAVIEDLSTGKIRKKQALEELYAMKRQMEAPVVNKRAIPGFLPSDKNIYRGICGLVILGAKPSAMTIADSRKMKLPMPTDYNSDKIRVSMKRLILVLTRLGLAKTSDGDEISLIIKKLWQEANEYCNPPVCGKRYNAVDEESSHWKDEIELGMLKWLMYGVSANQPSWFSKVFCMPCSNNKEKHPLAFSEHPASEMGKKSGDLVSHDVVSCYLCRNATGCLLTQRSNVATSSFDSYSGNSTSRLSLKETESDESGNSDGNHEIEISQAILQETTGIAVGDLKTSFPT